jgi:hypothetical protein
MLKIGTAMLISAAFAHHFWAAFAHHIAENSEIYAYNMALHSIPQSAATELGTSTVIPAIFMMLCLGAAFIVTHCLFTLTNRALYWALQYRRPDGCSAGVVR